MTSPRILLITPPLTQINTPYPATAYLKGFLGSRGFTVRQADLGIELVLRLFSAEGLREVFREARQSEVSRQPHFRRMLALEKDYVQTVDAVIRFLQGKDATTASRIVAGNWLPEGKRFEQVGDLEWAFGTMGISDQAKFLATLYLEDLGDLIRECVSAYFGFSRYAESLAMAATSFAPIEQALQQLANLTDQLLEDCLIKHIDGFQPDLVGFSVPFPGNLYGALRCAKFIKQQYPGVQTLMGGGYVNTELRNLREQKVFQYVDFITLDDGESPLLRIIEHWQQQRPASQLHRTFTLTEATVTYQNGCRERDIAHSEVGTPDYSDLPLDQYLSVIEVANPMHRLWNDGRWNKLTIAHGCYWKKCSFCDVTLDYIARYETAPATQLVDRIETLVAQTGQTGFHFVDEAAPPLALRDLAIELLRRGTAITWWTNIRFEKTFTSDLCQLLAASGCIAVSGGLEVASDRLLALMEKGVTVEQVARVAHSFTQAGIMVHAYLMYGFPTQTAQETVDSLEIVRQLMENGVVQSGFWHRFAMTAHSPVGKNPAKYQVAAVGAEPGDFAHNDLPHNDPTGCDHGLFGAGLAKAMFNYLHGVFLEKPVNYWFDFPTPRPTVPRNFIARAITNTAKGDWLRLNSQVLWLGNLPEIHALQNKKAGNLEMTRLNFYEKTGSFSINIPQSIGGWLTDWFPQLTVDNPQPVKLKEVASNFPASGQFTFEQFVQHPAWRTLREKGLVLV